MKTLIKYGLYILIVGLSWMYRVEIMEKLNDWKPTVTKKVTNIFHTIKE